MTFPMKDGVAVITGAGSGIGRALSLDLAERGSHLALADRNAEPLHETAQRARQRGIKVSEHVLDVADVAALAALFLARKPLGRALSPDPEETPPRPPPSHPKTPRTPVRPAKP